MNIGSVLILFFSFVSHEDNGVLQTIYEGRTPCQELGAMLSANVSPDCWKIKWRLTLNRNPETKEPATFEMTGILRDKQPPLNGTWKITKGTALDPQAEVYELIVDAGNPGKKLLLQKVDGVLFFLDQDKKLLVGDYNCSYTMNRAENKK